MSKIGLAALCVLAFTSAIQTSAAAERTGLISRKDGAFDGYTLFSPLQSTTTYLVDMKGAVVHTWEDEYTPGQSVYLLENGHLLRCTENPANRAFHGGGIGGRVREFDWDGKLVWEYVYSNDAHCQHHDIEPLPNGNVLVLAWEKKSAEEAIGAGRDPDQLSGDEFWPDHVVEVKRDGPNGGKIVWEWHAWDHLIQDFDSEANNYGEVAAHPERINVNFGGDAMQMPPDEMRRLRSLGYVGGPIPRSGPPGSADWLHGNSIDYNAKLDQILISVLGFNEIWVIDHGTTTAEAASHTGGRYGKGGDLLYRWGNPQAYRAGSADDQKLFGQHDATWITDDAGDTHILVFNNGRGRPGGDYSSVDEIAPPMAADGSYVLKSGSAYGPSEPVWQFTAPTKSDFFSSHISGAQRLPNGSTFICSGEQGEFFEVSSKGDTLWQYVNPFADAHRQFSPPDDPGGRRPPRPGARRGPEGADKNEGEQPNDRGRAHPPGRAGRNPAGSRPGPRDENSVFRATRIAADDPAIKSRRLGAKRAK